MNFKNKVVLVTGGATGIGSAVVEKFSSLGANIVLNYNSSSEKAKLLKEQLEKKYNNEILIIKADISKEEEIKEMINVIRKKFGKINILINNASIAIDTIIEAKTKANFMKTLEVNLIGTFLLSKETVLLMTEKNSSIINISSTNGIDTEYIESLDYDASKAGVISLTKNLAKAYGPNIRVNTVAPGWVDTDMNKDLSLEFRKKEEEKIILGRFAHPDEIANTVIFLASEEASYITSSIIRVDGGVK